MKYFYTNDKVIAVSSYKKRPVRAVAKCHPDDQYDKEYGEKLATARCDEKVTLKRYKHAQHKVEVARVALEKAKRDLDKAILFEIDSREQYENAVRALAKF